MEELIAKRYATALLSVSDDVKSVSTILNLLTEAISDEKVKTILHSPMVTAEQKTEMILSALGKEANTTVVNFIKILGENKRLDLIPAIAKVLNATLQKEANVYEGILTSKETLGKDELKKLEETLKSYTGATINLKQEQSDFDGLRVSVDDLGIEVNFSKERVKEQLIDFIKRSF
jgi:F-type H+-transporting ATPase subunit delta